MPQISRRAYFIATGAALVGCSSPRPYKETTTDSEGPAYPATKKHATSVKFSFGSLTHRSVLLGILVDLNVSLADEHAVTALSKKFADLSNSTKDLQIVLKAVEANTRNLVEFADKGTRPPVLKSLPPSIEPFQDGRFTVTTNLESDFYAYATSELAALIDVRTAKYWQSVTIDGILEEKDGVVAGELKSIGTTLIARRLNKSSNLLYLDTFASVKINPWALAAFLRDFPITVAQTRTQVLATLKGSLAALLRGRYKLVKSTSTPKSELRFKVDFATAKSRLQRALGDYRYEEGKSTFVATQSFSSPIDAARRIAHVRVIALFPDRSDTVVQFQGEYESLNDSFGGPDLYGLSSISEAMDTDIRKVTSLLSY